MTPFRHVPPAHSPLPARALAAGLRAALGAHDASLRAAELVERDWGARDVLLAGSGTAALALALRAAAASRPGAPAALPAYGCYDLATAADGADLPVVLYDVDPETLAPDPASFDRALAADPCAVVVVHHCGVPVDVERLAGRVADAGALLVEDAAQAVGARIGERAAGSLGPVAVLSFGRGKGLTGGAGGALLAHDGAGEAVVRRARLHVSGTRSGWRELAGAAAQWALARPSLYALPAALPFLRLGDTVYRAPEPPEPLSRAAAAILAAGWEESLHEAAVRRRNAGRLQWALAAAGARVPRPPANATAGFLRLPVLADGEAGRARAASPGARRLGIMPGYPRALCDLEGFRARVANADDGFPGARRLAEALFTLPTHSHLAEADLRRLEAWIAGERAAPLVAGRSAPA
ncbi:MAG TPA: DegT/DnrJ/EryC1/StrS family aminotransferase [Longimicrobium sp.]